MLVHRLCALYLQPAVPSIHHSSNQCRSCVDCCSLMLLLHDASSALLSSLTMLLCLCAVPWCCCCCHAPAQPWNEPTVAMPQNSRTHPGYFSTTKPVRYDAMNSSSLNNRFAPLPGIRTAAVLSLDDDIRAPCSALRKAFKVWEQNTNNLVGFFPRLHKLQPDCSHSYLTVSTRTTNCTYLRNTQGHTCTDTSTSTHARAVACTHACRHTYTALYITCCGHLFER